MQLNLSSNSGAVYDFTSTSGSGSGGGIPQNIVNIIESNIGTSIGSYIGYTEMEELNGFPYIVRKWVDSSKLEPLSTTTLTFSNGFLSEVVLENNKTGLIKTTNITWVDGKFFSASSVVQ
jgi:hypothetical protein